MEAPQKEDLAALIKRVIDETGAKQAHLAEKSGISVATFNAWAVGRRRPDSRNTETWDRLRALAKEMRRAQESAGIAEERRVTVAQVYEAAGREVPAPLDAERQQRVWRKYLTLTPAHQRAVDQLIESLEREQTI